MQSGKRGAKVHKAGGPVNIKDSPGIFFRSNAVNRAESGLAKTGEGEAEAGPWQGRGREQREEQLCRVDRLLYFSAIQRLRVSTIFWAWALLEMLNLDLGRYCPFCFW